MSFRRWKTGEVIGQTRLVPQFQKTYDAPYYVVHRADYLEALQARAVELGVEVKTGCKVVEYDIDAPSVTLENGSKHYADLVVAAEGDKYLPSLFELWLNVSKVYGLQLVNEFWVGKMFLRD